MDESILVVDDEKDIVDVLEYNLRKAGYRVLTAMDGRAALDAAGRDKPSLVLLDLMLPELSGTEVLKTLRANASTRAIPVIMLTACGEEIDRLLGFELGADDYVTKPFSAREVILRVKAVLRRNSSDDVAPGSEVLCAGPIELNPASHTVRVSGQEVEVTLTEFRLLADLLKARGRVRTRGGLMSEVWGYNSDVMSRTVDTHVRRLREKLGAGADWVQTVRGVGYRIVDPMGE